MTRIRSEYLGADPSDCWRGNVLVREEPDGEEDEEDDSEEEDDKEEDDEGYSE